MGFIQQNCSHTPRLIKTPSGISPQHYWNLISDLQSTLFSVLHVTVISIVNTLRPNNTWHSQTDDVIYIFFLSLRRETHCFLTGLHLESRKHSSLSNESLSHKEALLTWMDEDSSHPVLNTGILLIPSTLQLLQKLLGKLSWKCLLWSCVILKPETRPRI